MNITDITESIQIEYKSSTNETTFIIIQNDIFNFEKIYDFVKNNQSFIIKAENPETNESVDFEINDSFQRIDIMTSNNTIIMKG